MTSFPAGEIPQTLFNLSSLRNFELGSNNLGGILPTDMCYSLPRLQVINLSQNQLKGEIPPSLSNCGELQVLGLSINEFIGRIPSGIGNLSGIEKIYLGGNNLMGTIPSSFGNLSALKTLYLAKNKIQGNIPKELGHLSELQYLSLASNILTGSVPEAIFNISNLQFIVLADNHLSGNLPSSIGTSLPQLEELLIGGNYLSGIIPASISNITKLTRLDLSYNLLTGFVPKDLGNLRSLQHLGFGNNQLSGEYSTSELGFLTSLSNCKFLRNLWIQDNPLKGTLPNSLGNLSLSLESINASACQFKGVIPAGIGNLTNLIELGLGDNDLTGMIPTTLGQLKKLQRLYIAGNRIHGSVPNGIGHLANLVYLFLSSNQLSGLVPSSLWSLNRLLVVNLSSNFLTGDLPVEVGSMKTITKLDLSQNQFSGHIPSTMGQLGGLVELSLSKNRLQGPIPREFGNLLSLESLDLSWNNLSGAIPRSLEALVSLKYLNVSFNKLEGEIPDKGPFANFTTESFISNAGLCGAARFQIIECEKDASGQSRNATSFLLKCILIPVVAAMVFVPFVVLIRRRRSKSKAPAQVNSFHLGKLRRISHQELIYATNYFGEDNMIGTGSLGMVHRGVLSDGSIVAVKVFNLEFQGAFKSFDAECEIMRNIRHRNLVKIISSCSILNFKALVLEYMPNGSLEKWLYSHNYCLNLVQRLNIMIDVASALEYLHHDFSVNPVVHCDLKPNNVLLDEEMVARLGDFGISKLLTETESMEQTRTLGTIGYMAPGKKKRVTHYLCVYKSITSCFEFVDK